MTIAVVGAGPAGAYVAGVLGRAGYEVLLFDRRTDPARPVSESRSIQLSLSPRGLKALAGLGLEPALRTVAIPLDGRAFHPPGGGIDVQRPPEPTWKNLSVGRGDLTRVVLDWALACPRVTPRFGEACVEVVRASKTVLLQTADGRVTSEKVDAVVGADGTASEVRTALVRSPSIDFAKKASMWGYAELTIGALAGRHRYETPAIHIWPRGHFFVVAFPALDGSYRGTLVARHEDWEAGQRSGTLEAQYAALLTDLWPHLGASASDLLEKPLSPISIIRCGSWDDGGFMFVLGDAAHATAPFMGQGVNLALEDASVFASQLASHPGDLAGAIRAFGRARVAEGIACCDLSERAANLLLRMPPPGADPSLSPLTLLNFKGWSYADVARKVMPGWRPRVYADAFPPSAVHDDDDDVVGHERGGLRDE